MNGNGPFVTELQQTTGTIHSTILCLIYTSGIGFYDTVNSLQLGIMAVHDTTGPNICSLLCESISIHCQIAS